MTRATKPNAVLPVVRNLRDLRAAAGLSQREIADRLGVSESQVSRWENSTNLPSVEAMKRYIGACGGQLDVTVRFPGGISIKIERDVE